MSLGLSLGMGSVLGLRRRRAPIRRFALRRFALLVHEARPEQALRLILIVHPTPQPNARHRRLAAAGEGLDVIVLHPSARLAAVPGLTHERALAAIAFPDGASYVRRDVALARSGTPPPRARLIGRREL